MHTLKHMRIILSTLLIGAVPIGSAYSAELPIVGLIEDVRLVNLNMLMSAKIDTGAKTSAINAIDIEPFTNNDKNWVRFIVKTKKGTSKKLERPIHRISKIRRAGTTSDRRYVVLLKICMGGLSKNAQFTLKNRKSMNYAMLIGRRVLDGNFLVNSEKSRLTKPLCS